MSSSGKFSGLVTINGSGLEIAGLESSFSKNCKGVDEGVLVDDGLCDPNSMTLGLLVTVEVLVDGLEFPKAKVVPETKLDH